MSRRNKIIGADDQPTLFQCNENQPPAQVKTTYSRLEELDREDKRIRNSFTSKEEYYESPQWKSKRLQKLRLVGHKCEVCGRTGSLDVHHLNYNHLYDELMEDLQALCRYHHVIADGNREYASGLSTFVYKKHGDYAGHADMEYEEGRFREWCERNKW